MYADGLKQALRGKMYGDGDGCEGMGTDGTVVMGMGWGETCGDGVENK